MVVFTTVYVSMAVGLIQQLNHKVTEVRSCPSGFCSLCNTLGGVKHAVETVLSEAKVDCFSFLLEVL